MFLTKSVLLLVLSTVVVAKKCDHTPSMVRKGVAPLPNDMFEMTVLSQGKDFDSRFQPDRKYTVTLRTMNSNHTFRWFMITVEDPDIDKSNYEFRRQPVDVGRLKTLDGDRTSKYSETCLNTVENIDNSEKETVSLHWLSPKSKDTETVRIRAMVAKNAEAWYVEPGLSVELTKNNERSIDSPPRDAVENCSLCSEARYEVIFKGQWSRLTHPQQFPINMDKNAYSYMVGASHDFKFTLWEEGARASPGLKQAAETANTDELEKEVLKAVGFDEKSTRTLIRGRRNAHPNMFNPSHALFRVDRLHHLFSVFIAIQPSPDWFLGAQKFELCSDEGWLEQFKLPLYPWDAGTMDGVSYNSNKKMTSPQDNVGRVALGSFDRDSPFYQLNLNDLKPFGHLVINLLDVYPVKDCSEKGTNREEGANNLEVTDSPDNEEEQEQPQVSESRSDCGFSKWEPWSPCSPYDGHCGSGNQFRTRYRMNWNRDGSHMNRVARREEKCIADLDKRDTEYQECYVDC